jgi:hypothetical protein
MFLAVMTLSLLSQINSANASQSDSTNASSITDDILSLPKQNEDLYVGNNMSFLIYIPISYQAGTVHNILSRLTSTWNPDAVDAFLLGYEEFSTDEIVWKTLCEIFLAAKEKGLVSTKII